MSRGRWLIAGFGVGLVFVGAVVLLLRYPRTRRFIRDVAEELFERVSAAVREGIRAARVREIELEHELAKEEESIRREGPDYVV